MQNYSILDDRVDCSARSNIVSVLVLFKIVFAHSALQLDGLPICFFTSLDISNRRQYKTIVVDLNSHIYHIFIRI